MISLRGLVGLPVIAQGRTLGLCEAGYLNESGEELLGLAVRKGLGGAKFLPKDQIVGLGGICILARGEARRLPRGLENVPGPVWDTSGLRLGRVTDVRLQGLRTAALEISLGPVDDWRFGRMLAPRFTLIRDKGDVKVLTSLETLIPLRMTGKEGSHGPG